MTVDNTHEQPAVPPTQPFAVPVAERQSSWPTVIGIIAVVFGVLGILGGIWGAVSPLFVSHFINVSSSGSALTMGPMGNSHIWTIVLPSIGCLLAVILLAGGIGLNNRRRWAVRICMVWAVLKMFYAVAGAIVAALNMQQQTEIMAQQGNAPPMAGGFFEAFTISMVVFIILWGWALPVFMLIWFSRGKIKAEIAEWA